jgi:FKBP-type peptidyl-prolyl cis-trans isomerase 2
VFGDPENIQMGQRVQGESEGGGTFEASVTHVGPDEVTLDLNHPLAGRTVVFEVEVVEVL